MKKTEVILVRLPKKLKETFKAFAKEKGRSMSSQVVYMIKKIVGETK